MGLEIIITNLVDAHISEVLRVEAEAWPEELRASEEKFRSRLRIFPEGFFGACVNDILAGVLTSMRTSRMPEEKLTWNEITGNGYIKNHENNGDWLYVVSLGVSPKFSGRGVGNNLVAYAIKFAKNLGCAGLFLQARPIGYDSHCKANGDVPIEKYLLMRSADGKHIDKELRFYERAGLQIVKPVENGEVDAASRNYTVSMQYLVK